MIKFFLGKFEGEIYLFKYFCCIVKLIEKYKLNINNINIYYKYRIR